MRKPGTATLRSPLSAMAPSAPRVVTVMARPRGLRPSRALAARAPVRLMNRKSTRSRMAASTSGSSGMSAASRSSELGTPRAAAAVSRRIGQPGTAEREVEVADAFECGGRDLRGSWQVRLARDPDERLLSGGAYHDDAHEGRHAGTPGDEAHIHAFVGHRPARRRHRPGRRRQRPRAGRTTPTAPARPRRWPSCRRPTRTAAGRSPFRPDRALAGRRSSGRRRCRRRTR